MMKQLIHLFCLALLLVAPGWARDIDTVLVVSIDALHPDALNQETTPILQSLMQSGHYTLKGRSVDPPKTLIAHAAMFTGLSPALNGKRDNDWKPGMPQVRLPTLFDDAKALGYRTAFYYAKPKLGYLINDAIDAQGVSSDDGVNQARAFFRQAGRRFVVLHLSGLEYAGTESGWLSQDYLDTLSSMDMELAGLFEEVGKRGEPLIIVTSDHAGHDKLHGTTHPDDYKLPLIIVGAGDMPRLPDAEFAITELRGLLTKLLAQPGRE